jgi:radical SAM protein with 4Fe4S-binding SPASM domain
MPRTQRYTPQQVVWELTLQCNLHCIHCGSSAGSPRPRELTLQESLQVTKDLAALNTREVCLMGGEPFLRKGWHNIAHAVTNAGMKLLIITNGYAITQETFSHLTALQPYAVSTSLDGATPATHDRIRGMRGSFEKVQEFISQLTIAGLPTTVITTVNKLNFTELSEIKNFLLDKHIAWQVQTAAPEGRFKKNLALSKEEFYAVGLFLAALQKRYTKEELPVIGAHCFGYHSHYIPCLGLSPRWTGCQAGLSILSIKSNGDITGCLSTPSTYVEANIRKKSIIDIWNDPEAFAYNRKFTKENLGENCKGCTFGETCKGGCLGMSTAFTTTPHNDPYCFHTIEAGFCDEGIMRGSLKP